MSTVSAPAPPAAPATPTPETGLVGYFSQTSTRWDLFKWIVPMVVVLLGYMIQQHYDVLDLKAQVAETKQICATFQQAKEDRGNRMATLEALTATQGKQIDHIDQKVDVLLERSSK